MKRLIISAIAILVLVSLFCPLESAFSSSPPAPANLSIVAGKGEASLTWSAAAGATSYLVYHRTYSTDPYAFVAETQGTGYTCRDLWNDNYTHQFVVAALNADGQSPYSAPISVVPLSTLLKAPANLSVIAGNTAATLTWDAVTNAVFYNVYRSTTMGGPYTKITGGTDQPPSPTGSSFTDRTLVNGTDYYYVVQSASPALGAYSEEVSVRPSSLLPAAPELTVSPGSTWAGLTWTAVPGASYYLVYRGLNEGRRDWLMMGEAEAAPITNAYDATGMDNDPATPYFFSVFAVNAKGIGAVSNEVSVKPSLIAKPHAPKLSGVARHQQAGLSWDSAFGATSVTLLRSTTPGGPYGSDSEVKKNLGASSYFWDENLNNGTLYCYLVRAYNHSNFTADSNEICLTPVETPAVPTNVKVAPGNGQATVTWDPVVDSPSYVVTVNGNPYNYSGSMETPALTCTGLLNNTTYTFSACSSSSANCSPGIAATTSASLPLAPTIHGDGGNGEAVLTWNEVPGATGYRVYRTTKATAWPSGPVGTTTDAVFLEKGLTNDVDYYYRVAAVNGGVEGASSGEYKIRPSSIGLLPSPMNVAVLPGNGQATVTWNPVAGAMNYQVVFSETPTGSPVKGCDAVSATPSCTVTGLTNTKTYYVRIHTNLNTSAGTLSLPVGVLPSGELPFAPLNVRTLAGNGEATLTWDPVSGATGYKVFRTTLRAAWPSAPLAPTTTNAFHDTGLSKYETYYYRVAAVNTAGPGSWSEETSVRTGMTPLPAPTHVSVIPGNTQATVTWDPVPGATAYLAEATETPGGATLKSCTSSLPGCTISNLPNGPYYFHVRSADAGGGAASDPVSATLSGSLSLAATIGGVTPGNSQITLWWNPVTNATGYRVYRSVAGGAWSASPVGTTTTTYFTDSGLSNGVQYSYAVAAEIVGNAGAWSGAVSSVPISGCVTAPVNLRTFSGNGQTTLVWDPVADATAYRVLIGTAPGRGDASYDTANTFYTFNYLTIPQTYYLRVLAASASGWCATSGEVNATTSAALPSTTSGAGTIAGNTQMTLYWNPVANATGYRVYRSVAGGPWSSSPVTTSTGTYFTDSGLSNGVQYSYAVAAEIEGNAGAWSGAVSSVPISGCVTAPVNVVATPGNQQITVTWDPAPGATSYQVKIASSPGGNPVNSYSGSVNNCTFTGLTNGQVYYLRVQSFSGSIGCALANEVSAVPSPEAYFGNITGKISVNIPGYGDIAVRNATVTLKEIENTTIPDANGNFTFLNVPYGDYHLVVTAEKMDTLTQTVTLAEGGMRLTLQPLNITPVCPTCPTCQTCPVPGDANGDGHADLGDVIYILQVMTGIR